MEPGSPPPLEGWVLVAVLGRTRGLKGEIYADGRDRPERYAALKRVWVRKPDGEFANQGEPLAVTGARPYKGRLLFRFAGIDSVDAAESLTGCDVVVPRAERPSLPEGEYYLADLVGCGVFDRSSGRKLGTVTGWQESGGPMLLEMTAEGGRPEEAVWIPFARSICVEIDPAGRRLVLEPPEGLLELNQPAGASQSAELEQEETAG
ncbi:MAG: 16S rRNA processing protein RimM [Candidatus Solibacter usitatus]|nr:16S rRNA processing protein RimM [Candidatus Solibacter usitatus]